MDSRVDDVRGAAPRLTLVGAAAVGVVALDQFTKWWAIQTLADGATRVGPIRFVLSHNKGAAFGLGAGFVPVIALAAIVVVVVAIVMGRATARPVTAVASGLLLGGALGNLSDRLFRSPGALRGAVIDFIDVGWWPVFNVADSAITVGCALLVLFSANAPERAAAG